MFEGWKRERQVRKVLRGLARQRVALVAQPRNLWVIELALPRTSENEAALGTCMLRGWIEPMQENLPTGNVNDFMAAPSQFEFKREEALYRLTEGGWAALQRAHTWNVLSVIIGLCFGFAAVAMGG